MMYGIYTVTQSG